MFLSDTWDEWCFMLQLKTGELVPVDLSSEEDWGDIEPVRDNATGKLECTIGKHDGDCEDVVVGIAGVWGRSDELLNGKFPRLAPVKLEDFVSKLLDAGDEFHGQNDAACLKKEYGL